MNAPLRIRELHVHRLSIPVRVRFGRDAGGQSTAHPIIVTLSAASPYAHVVGCGETHAHPHVTGETTESVVEDIGTFFAQHLSQFHAERFVEGLERIESLPIAIDGRIATAARAAVELALLDLTCRAFRRRPCDVAGWLGLGGFGPPGCLASARCSGLVVGHTRGRLQAALRLQRLFGLRDFKLEVATRGWQDRLRWASELLHRPIRLKRVTLRVDAEAGWSLAEANEAVPLLEDCGVSAIEQPLADAVDDDLPYLAEQTSCDLIADESLLTVEDAERLAGIGGVRVLNVRIAKNGGLMPSLRIARLALTRELDVQLGCTPGETGILAAAGLSFLETCPRVRFAECALGRFVLSRDIVRGSVGVGIGGRFRARAGHGLGVTVDPSALERLAVDRPRHIPL
jgi:muconate cycloisomerase